MLHWFVPNFLTDWCSYNWEGLLSSTSSFISLRTAEIIWRSVSPVLLKAYGDLSSSTSCLSSAFTLVLLWGARIVFFLLSFLNDIPVMLIRLTLNRVEDSKQPLYPFFVCFLIRILPSEPLITKKEYNHCTATKFNPYLRTSNNPYSYTLFVMNYAPISLKTTMVLRKLHTF